MPHQTLSTYLAKRDFTKTAEPSGIKAVPHSERLRFVIQKHDATRLHYDFRLELDGVFKSWAVTRGPSLDPHDKRLAVEVEDHPLDYGDFEGTIPEGQYGGGTVQLWDRGYWMPEGSESPEKALGEGELKFHLEGDKLHGSWVLVRLKADKRRSKHNNWLLIKHRDEAAREGDSDALLAKDRSVASGRTLEAIAAGKGKGPTPFMHGGAKVAAADAVWNSNHGDTKAKNPEREASARATSRKSAIPKSGMPEFIPPQLCASVQRPPNGEE
jgi:bifunctional non-homologous end joining protein LigD